MKIAKLGNKINEKELAKQCAMHVVGCRICGNDYRKLKNNNNSIRYCKKCDKAV